MEAQIHQLALIFAIVASCAIIGFLLRQPLVVAYIAAGILIGSTAVDIVAIGEPVRLLAELGIVILLFLVGLRLDLSIIRSMGPVALATGLGQVVFTSVFGYFIALGLGYGNMASIYIAVALTFSSTIIIVKLLSDKREIDALHGRIAVGFLIVQDIVVILVMIVLSALGDGSAASPQDVPWHIAAVVGRGIAFVAAVGLLMRFILPRLVHFLSRSRELMILFAISWAIGLATLGEAAGFSKEVGAFLAGVALASTPFRDAIGGRLTSLRDFLLLFFFVELGSGLDLAVVGAQLFQGSMLSLFVLIGNPLIVMIIMGYMGYRKRTGFLAGLTVAQISEFSLILANLGLTLGHIDASTVAVVTLVGLVTIAVSTYLIMYSHILYAMIAPALSLFERSDPHRERDDAAEKLVDPVDVIIIGLGRFGRRMADQLRTNGIAVLGVDFDPEVVRSKATPNLKTIYGDAEDPELVPLLPLVSAKWVVCAAPSVEANRTAAKILREHGYCGKIALTARHQSDVAALSDLQADVLFQPLSDAALFASDHIRSHL